MGEAYIIFQACLKSISFKFDLIEFNFKMGAIVNHPPFKRGRGRPKAVNKAPKIARIAQKSASKGEPKKRGRPPKASHTPKSSNKNPKSAKEKVKTPRSSAKKALEFEGPLLSGQYAPLVQEAIQSLREKRGSSKKAIVNYVMAHEPDLDEDKVVKGVRKAMKKMIDQGILVSKSNRLSGSFKMAKEYQSHGDVVPNKSLPKKDKSVPKVLGLKSTKMVNKAAKKEVQGEPKKRGRPPMVKAVVNDPVLGGQAEAPKNDAVDSGPAEAPEEPAQSGPAEAPEEPAQSGLAQSGQKRGRGRPKKIGRGRPKKIGRGRPKKIKV